MQSSLLVSLIFLFLRCSPLRVLTLKRGLHTLDMEGELAAIKVEYKTYAEEKEPTKKAYARAAFDASAKPFEAAQSLSQGSVEEYLAFKLAGSPKKVCHIPGDWALIIGGLLIVSSICYYFCAGLGVVFYSLATAGLLVLLYWSSFLFVSFNCKIVTVAY